MLVIALMVTGFSFVYYNAGLHTAIGVYLMVLAVAANNKQS